MTGEPALTFVVTTPADEHGFHRVRVECPGGHCGQLHLPRRQVDALLTLFRRGNRQRLHGAVEFEEKAR